MGDTERNQFKKLRYKDENSLNADITVRDMAEMVKLGASTVSKAEREGVNSAHAATIKAYHDGLKDVSYEYLFGEVPTRDKKYHSLGELFPFDDSFYNNLEQLLELDSGNHFVEYMLSALLDDAQALFTALITVFDSLYQINNIQQDKELPANAKTEKIKMHEYIFSQSMIEYLESAVMPLLGRAFKAKEEYLVNEAKQTEDSIKEIADKIVEPSVIGRNVIATPMGNDGSCDNQTKSAVIGDSND